MVILKYFLFFFLSEMHIKRRWKNIRTTYARECRKSENKSDSNPDNQYVSKWAFIDRLGFVKDFIKARAPNNYNSFNSNLSSSTADQSENFQVSFEFPQIYSL